MNVTQKEYDTMIKKSNPPSRVVKDCVCAFLVGGVICCIGQGFGQLYTSLGADREMRAIAVTLTLVLLSVLLTGIGVYDDIARHSGAGTLVPITGFANSVASPALEFKSEGYVLGMAAKMFIIAGPVIVYGVSASVIYGFIYWLITLV